MRNKDIRESIDLIKKIHNLNESTSINELDKSTYASAIDKMSEKDFKRADEMINTIASKYMDKIYKTKNGEEFKLKNVSLLNNAIEFKINDDSVTYRKDVDTLSRKRMPRGLAKAMQMIISKYNPDSKYAKGMSEFIVEKVEDLVSNDNIIENLKNKYIGLESELSNGDVIAIQNIKYYTGKYDYIDIYLRNTTQNEGITLIYEIDIDRISQYTSSNSSYFFDVLLPNDIALAVSDIIASYFPNSKYAKDLSLFNVE